MKSTQHTTNAGLKLENNERTEININGLSSFEEKHSV